MAIAIRISLQIQTQTLRLSPLRRLFVPFSSSSYGDPRVAEEQGNSAVHRYKLRFQRPRSIQWRSEYLNSASFIGTVAQPLKCFKEGKAYTVLTVGDSSHSKEAFRILLQFYDEMARMCLEYLKENDYIHVSGRLQTDIKPTRDGNLSLYYRLKVSKVNYVSGIHDVIFQSNKELQTVEDRTTVFYKPKLKFQRPSSIQWRYECCNSASFIGTVAQPLKIFREGKAYTVLTVRNSPQSNESFRILLHMRGEMAKMCLEYLKENDYIYVSGRLRTDPKLNSNGILRLHYRLVVYEVNYVARSHDAISQNNREPQTNEGMTAMLEKFRDRLHLWQIFFSSAHEWWDNRNCKTNPNKPDFRHKDTGEVLWLKPNDPPWVYKQIQLLDSRLGERGDSEPVGRRACLSKWDFDDLQY